MKPQQITAKTAAWSSHDLTRNNELAVSSSTNLYVYRYQMLNVFFFYFKNQTTKQTQNECNLSNLQRYTSLPHLTGEGFLSYKRIRIENHQYSPLVRPFELHVKQTPFSIACDWLIFLLSDALPNCVGSCLLNSTLQRPH